MHVVIIGGGASGVMAAINAKTSNNKVTIIERNNDLLKKLLMTGNGKCNYLNETYSLNDYYSCNIDIVDKIIIDKNINACKEFFDKIGIISKVKNGYYYPFSNQAITLKNALLKEVHDKDISIINNCLVEDVYKEKDRFVIKSNLEDIKCDYLVFAMGGKTYSKTGSDGLGYTLLNKLGHTIINPLPALVPLKSNLKYTKEWAGVRTDVELSLFEDDEFIKLESGELQLTDYGLSGICIFNLSHIVTRGLARGKKEVIKINFIPFVKTLITPWMDKFSKDNSNKNICELLEGILNYKLVNIILKYNKIDGLSYYKDLTNEDKLKLCTSLRAFPVLITETKGNDFAQVTNGGVKLDEINYQTMESKKINNLYIIGELLDMNGNCGGYNLTTCWISGILAGKSIGDKCAKSKPN